MQRLTISDGLRAQLAQVRRDQLQHPHPDEFLVREEVVVLTSGLGPEIYLRFDGMVIIWHYMNDEERRPADLQETAEGIVIGARSLNLPELVDLLPSHQTPLRIAQCARENAGFASTRSRLSALPVEDSLGSSRMIQLVSE
jgi:hypothetical protein